jgi:hypothetical protein
VEYENRKSEDVDVELKSEENVTARRILIGVGVELV